MSLLEVTDLHATVGAKDQQKAILKGLNISVNPGEVHAIMGPNGSGKSTLANVLSGKPGYTVTGGTLTLTDTDLTELEPHERAQLGLFLAFQYPVEIPGVSNMEFLKASVDSLARARGEEQPNTAAFIKQVRLLATSVDLDPQFLKRGVNEGFSGGEKKRNEIMQLLLLEPKLAILDHDFESSFATQPCLDPRLRNRHAISTDLQGLLSVDLARKVDPVREFA